MTTAMQAITLRSGLNLKNRIVKAAMEENMGNAELLPDERLIRLYRSWSEGNVGLILTGNVMVDNTAMTGPSGIALTSEKGLESFSKLSGAAKSNGNSVVMQINHPGRQVFKSLGTLSYSASDVELQLGKHSKLFAKPIPMSENHIQSLIAKFINTAQLAQRAGFDGVQVHAAHGYLLSQFLSPSINQRTDKWGGNLENRSRLLVSIIKGIKQNCGQGFSVSLKLNSADFQKGGFKAEEAQEVVAMLEPFNLDFIELSGGSYESPAMQGTTADGTSLAREAYFLEFAAKIAKSSKTPIMTTGGITRLSTVEKVLAQDVQLVGIASGLACVPDLVKRWEDNPDYQVSPPKVTWRNKTLSGLSNMAMIRRQLQRLGNGKKYH